MCTTKIVGGRSHGMPFFCFLDAILVEDYASKVDKDAPDWSQGKKLVSARLRSPRNEGDDRR